MGSVVVRAGTSDDSEAVFRIFLAAITDLGSRLGVETITGGAEPGGFGPLWVRRRPLFDHLAATADRFVIAEAAGRPVGYARSTLREGLRELTEFFVLPGEQSGGCGRLLLERALPRDEPAVRCLIATTDTRALALYLRHGLCARFPIYYFSRTPRALPPPMGIVFSPLDGSAAMLEAVATVDAAVLGHRRDADHMWLAGRRQGFLARRAGAVVGYGYQGEHSGPFAALDEADLPRLLAHAESLAAAAGAAEFGVDVPLVNQAAVSWLLEHRYRLGDFITYLMSDTPFGRFENYLITTPSFFL